MNEKECSDLLAEINKYKKTDSLIIFDIFYLKETKLGWPKVYGYNTEVKEKRYFGDFAEIVFGEGVAWKMTRMKNRSSIVQFENKQVQAGLSWPYFCVNKYA
jgi:hypothetical protein